MLKYIVSSIVVLLIGIFVSNYYIQQVFAPFLFTFFVKSLLKQFCKDSRNVPINNLFIMASKYIQINRNVCYSILFLVAQQNPPEEMASPSNVDFTKAQSIYDFTVKDTFGEDISLEKYRGNVVLIVNIASQCGLTKANYAQLTELKEKYQERGKKDSRSFWDRI